MEKFDFDDLVIVPGVLSKVNSRQDISVLDSYGMLPIFTAPMDTVVDRDNYLTYLKLGINVCVPRNTPTFSIENSEDVFVSISLDEFEDFVNKYLDMYSHLESLNILVDIANGHMSRLYDLSKKFVKIRKTTNHVLMVGNIANPKTYKKYCDIGVDYVRVGIGGGSGCLTSANTGVHYPMASLISECYTIKKKGMYSTRIVADGGFKRYDQIIKALSLGADYVMLGGIFNQSLESCGRNYIFNHIEISQNLTKLIWYEYPILRRFLSKSFRGMSTKEVQRKWNRHKITTSEGISKKNKIKYTLSGWIENFSDYLKTTMSYCGVPNLDDFKSVKHEIMTNNSFNRYNK